MYRFTKTKHHRLRHDTHSHGFGGRLRSGMQRHTPSLDPRLFVKKATDTQFQSEYVSLHHFSEYPITDIVKQNIANHGYSMPTAIQEQAIPEILAGRDLIGMAKTGTGKTAAFLITLINKVYLDRNERVLIVVPTRELAIQIEEEFHIFAHGTGIHAVSAIGGANIARQAYILRYHPNFVIGTPGRLKDLIKRRELDLSLFTNVILDEVDRMVDIGFIKDIQYLISLLPIKRQSLFFSATVDMRTKEILNRFVTDPVTVSVKEQQGVEHIDQDIIRVTQGKSKIETLHDLLIQPEFQKVIIFGRTKWGIEKLSKALEERGFKAATIHGNKSQNQRQRALTAFKHDERNILLATDVASRGLDIENVTHVINYDIPETYDDYIHRIGRTGRAGKHGVALTFID